MFRKTLLITLGLTAIGGTALACIEYSKPKVEKISIHSGDSKNENHSCTLVQTDSPRIHNTHCKPSPTPFITPKVTPTPAATPKATPTSIGPKPVVTPTSTPSASPTPASTTTTATEKTSAVLPSVGGTAKLHK
jgi:hypothetical protein